MEPISNCKTYLDYRALLSHVRNLIRYCEQFEDDVHNDEPEIQKAKRELLKTKCQMLDAKGGQKISIDRATPQQVNMAFAKSFSDSDIDMLAYLKTKTLPWYETRIRNYESRIKTMPLETASISDLLTAKIIAKRENNQPRTEQLHQTIEEKLNSCSREELSQIWKTNQPYSVGLLMQEYTAFRPR